MLSDKLFYVFIAATLLAIVWGARDGYRRRNDPPVLPYCECAGHTYRSIACNAPPGLPPQCYRYGDSHASRVW